MNTPNWIQKSIELYNQGKKDDAMDVIFNTIDDMLWLPQNSPCSLNSLAKLVNQGIDSNKPIETAAKELNEILAQPFILELPSDLLLGVITITRSARHWLPSRKDLCAKAKIVFDSRNQNGEALLKYLDIP